MIKTFITPNGLSVPAVSALQMAEIDRIAIEETGPNLFQMMENAGRTLAMHSLNMLEQNRKTGTIVILAGTGGNGGGGICAARHLKNRDADVRLIIINPEKLRPVPAFQLSVYQAAGGMVTEINQIKDLSPDLIVDALIGYSLKGPVRGIMAELVQWANQTNALKLSLDIPSGVDATTGETVDIYFKADRTLTLALPKTGLLPEKTGKLYLADIGIPSAVYERIGTTYSNPFGNAFCVEISAR